MNAPDRVRLDAYRRALGFAIGCMQFYARHGNATEMSHRDFQTIWKWLGEVGETPVHVDRAYRIGGFGLPSKF